MSNQLQALKDQLALRAFGKTAAEAQEETLCINCDKPALPRCYSDAGVREYFISGLCERCFDKITGGE